MSDVQFQTPELNVSRASSKKGIANILVSFGFAKDIAQANTILTISAVVFLIITGVILKSFLMPQTEPQVDFTTLSAEEKAQIPPHILEVIEQNKKR